jgi:very-short-patch-repair endonuclease
MVRDRWHGGNKFKRQHPIGRYIADFACLEAKLIVELDGGQRARRQDYDAKRDAFFPPQGFCVVRFWNGEFLKNEASAPDQLLRLLGGRKTPSPQPSPPEGERE